MGSDQAEGQRDLLLDSAQGRRGKGSERRELQVGLCERRDLVAPGPGVVAQAALPGLEGYPRGEESLVCDDPLPPFPFAFFLLPSSVAKESGQKGGGINPPLQAGCWCSPNCSGAFTAPGVGFGARWRDKPAATPQ